MGIYWIGKRLEQRAALRACREKLASGSEPIWESLCQAVKDSIGAFFKAVPRGRFEQDSRNHHLYWVRYVEDTPNPNTEIKKVTITFDAAENTITAVYHGTLFDPRSLKLDLIDGDICFRLDKNNLHSADAAGYLLDPFLFPELAASPIPREGGYIEYLHSQQKPAAEN